MSPLIPIARPAALVDPELEMYRDSVARFLDRHASADAVERWREEKCVPRDFWRLAGDAGLLGPTIPAAYGGPGGDFRHDWIVLEETGRRGLEGFGVAVHNSIVAPYLMHFASEARKAEWLPGVVSGEIILAIAMTEPGAGSDLRGVRTRARPDGDDWVLTGQKTFISNGQSADLIVVVANVATDKGDRPSLFVVDATSEGFRRGTNLDKVGREAQDTSELYFDDVRVAGDHLLGGQPGRGMSQLMAMLPQERLVIAAMGQWMMERAIDETATYVRDRTAFGQRLIDFQNTQFRLSDARSRAAAARALLFHGLERHLSDGLDPTLAAMIKLFVTETEWKVIDDCVQLFGGYGYMNEYPIARLFRDARIDRVHGGSSEIMRLLIARDLTGD